MLNDYPNLTPTTTGVLSLALGLPYKDYTFTIFIDNLFTTYQLCSTLRKYGIRAVGTARVNHFIGNFSEEINDKNNGKHLG
jgi:hypothetical protein